MRYLIVNQNFSDIGGATKVALTVMDLLVKKGETVAAACFYKPKQTALLEQYQFDISNFTVFSRNLPRGLGKLSILRYLDFYRTILKAHRESRPDLTLFFDDVIDPKNLINSKIVVYSHFPLSVLRHFIIRGKLDPRRIFYKYMFKNIGKCDLVLANSSVTADYIRRFWAREAAVVYPPVEVHKFRRLQEKEDMVLMVGRFQPYKNFEDGIRAVAKSNSKPRLVIVGITGSRSYFRILKSLCSSLSVNATLVENISRFDLIELASKAKVIIHACKTEPFGISVVEAMAAGCVPIVYKDFGPWFDIIEEGRYGFGFSNVYELAHRIDDLILDNSFFTAQSEVAYQRAQYFREERFRNEIERYIIC